MRIFIIPPALIVSTVALFGQPNRTEGKRNPLQGKPEAEAEAEGGSEQYRSEWESTQAVSRPPRERCAVWNLRLKGAQRFAHGCCPPTSSALVLFIDGHSAFQ